MISSQFQWHIIGHTTFNMSKNSIGSFLDTQFVDFEVQAADRRLGEFQWR